MRGLRHWYAPLVVVLVTLIMTASALLWQARACERSAMSWANAIFSESHRRFVARLEMLNARMGRRLNEKAEYLTTLLEKRDAAALERLRGAWGYRMLILVDLDLNVVEATGEWPRDRKRADFDFIETSRSNASLGHGIVRFGDIFYDMAARPLFKADGTPVGYAVAAVQIDDETMRVIGGDSLVEVSLVGDRVVAASSLRVGGEPLQTLPIAYPLYRTLLATSEVAQTRLGYHRYLVAARPIVSLEVIPHASLMLMLDLDHIRPNGMEAFNRALTALGWFAAALLAVALLLYTATVLRPIRRLRRYLACVASGYGECPMPLDTLLAPLRAELRLLARRCGCAKEGSRSDRMETWDRLFEESPALMFFVEEGRLVKVNEAARRFFAVKSVEGFAQNRVLEGLFPAAKSLCDLPAVVRESKKVILRDTNGRPRPHGVRPLLLNGRCRFVLFLYETPDFK